MKNSSTLCRKCCETWRHVVLRKTRSSWYVPTWCRTILGGRVREQQDAGFMSAICDKLGENRLRWWGSTVRGQRLLLESRVSCLAAEYG